MDSSDKIKRDTKVKLYKAQAKSIFTYYCGTWALTQTEEAKLDAFHRQQRKQILNIKHPVKITNKYLYKNALKKPISITIFESQWRLLGHILRRDIDIHAKKALEAYFIPKGDKFRRRPIKTLPTSIKKDLCFQPAGELKLKTKIDPGDDCEVNSRRPITVEETISEHPRGS